MAGIADAAKLNDAKSVGDVNSLSAAFEDGMSAPGVSYARVFAECGPRSAKEKEALAAFAKEYGEGRAASLKAVCWFLHWGSYTGNTMNGIVGLKEGKDGMSPLFKATFFVYYFFLFFILINVVGLIIKPLPKVPKWFSAAFGVILATLAGICFVPLGVIGKIMDAKDTKAE